MRSSAFGGSRSLVWYHGVHIPDFQGAFAYLPLSALLPCRGCDAANPLEQGFACCLSAGAWWMHLWEEKDKK